MEKLNNDEFNMNSNSKQENLVILENWYDSYRKFPRLTAESIYSLYTRMVNINNDYKKELIRSQIIMGGIHYIYDMIKYKGIYNIKGKSFDIEDVLEEVTKEYVESIDNGSLIESPSLQELLLSKIQNVIKTMNTNIETEEDEVPIENISISYEKESEFAINREIAKKLINSIDERMTYYREYRFILTYSFGLDGHDIMTDRKIAEYIGTTTKEIKSVRKWLLELLEYRATQGHVELPADPQLKFKNKKIL